jgi:serine/threonine protein kinase
MFSKSILGSQDSLTIDNDIYLSGLKGTPAWMSPEVLTGRSISPATDVYGLGLIFFEMMSAEKIFEGKTVKEVSNLIY